MTISNTNSSTIEEVQDKLANQLLTTQAELLSILYQEKLLPVDIENSFSTTLEWNKYKKMHKITIKDFDEISQEVSNLNSKEIIQTKINFILELRLQIIQSFIPLIQFLAKRYAPYNNSVYSDLKSEGYIGLLKSLENFYYMEPNKHLKSYASFYIKQEMRRFLLENRQGYKIPYMASVKQKKLTDQNALESLEISSVQYFGDIYNQYGEDFENLIPSSIKDPFYSSWEKSLETTLQNIISSLPENEKTVLQLRYGMYEDQDKLSLERIGAIMGLSKERVRQIEKKALNSLQKQSKAVFRIEDLEDLL